MPSKSPSLIDFIEQPLFLTPAGVVAGIVGLVFYTPVLALCGLCVLLALHRSKIIAHWTKLPSQFSFYIFLGVFLCAVLAMLGDVIQNRMRASSEEFKNDIAKTVSKSATSAISGTGDKAKESEPAKPADPATSNNPQNDASHPARLPPKQD